MAFIAPFSGTQRPMLSTSTGYIDSCILMVPVIVGGTAAIAGSTLAMATAIACFAVVANLYLAERASRRFVAAAAGAHDPTAMGGFIMKQLTTLPLALVLLMAVGPVAVALALFTLFGGVVLQIVVQLAQSNDVHTIFGADVEESAC